MTALTPQRLDDGRELLDSGSPWEARMGYSRAVRAGAFVLVAGCVGILPDGTYPRDLAGQTARCLERIEEALVAFGC
ncbi:MAG: hypothetical protein KDA22_02870, partial [Phycisphaerales bacterium]|nr:hypothetical protein [Phycisphaerales bacterium]